MAAIKDVVVRLAVPEDAPVLAELANALDRDQGGDGTAHCTETVLRDGFGDEPLVRFVIATPDGLAAGYAMFCRFYNSDTAETGAYLNDLYVVPSLRRTGAGLSQPSPPKRNGVAARSCGRACTTRMRPAGHYASLGARDEAARILEIDGTDFQALAARGFAVP
jgi:hypothetical protein